MNLFKFHSYFEDARVKLTLWYLLILLFILGAFSFALYTEQIQNVTQIVLLNDFNGHLPRIVNSLQRDVIHAQVRALEYSLLINILIIDGVTIIVGTILSYLLAGKTLSPIKKMMDTQLHFIADASHELRTPLSAILTASEVALRSSSSKEEYRTILSQIFQKTQDMSKMVQDLLSLSRFDLEKEQSNFVLENLGTIMENALEDVASLASAKEITFKKEIEDVQVLCDQIQIQQICVILLDNAIKFSPAKGIIEIEVKSQPTPFISIKDYGIGVASEYKEKIFERFFQIDPARSNKGAGLGLSIAREIADIHDAVIEVVSEVGKGSTFLVKFPKEDVLKNEKLVKNETRN